MLSMIIVGGILLIIAIIYIFYFRKTNKIDIKFRRVNPKVLKNTHGLKNCLVFPINGFRQKNIIS